MVAIGNNVIALALAVPVDKVRIFKKSFFRSAFYIPVLISGIVAGLLYGRLCIVVISEYSIISFLHWGWISLLMTGWASPEDGRTRFIDYNDPSGRGPDINMIIYLAGLQSIPEELTEAAVRLTAPMDGSNSGKLRSRCWPGPLR